MNRFALIFIAVAALSTSAASAQEPQQPPDHLVPETSLISGGRAAEFGSSYAYIYRVFEDGYNYDVLARATVLPSFAAEYLVGIRRLGGEEKPTGYQAFYLLAPKLGFFKYKDDEDAKKNGPPKPPYEVVPLRCEKPVEADLAKRIVAVWQGVLLQTHYDNEGYGGPDGASFHFFAHGHHQDLAGWAWSPDEASKPGMLASLADALVAYCDSKATDAELNSKTVALERSLTP